MAKEEPVFLPIKSSKDNSSKINRTPTLTKLINITNAIWP